MASGTSEITFIVPGQAQPAARSADGRPRSRLGSRRHATRQRRAGARQRAPGRRRRRPQRRQRADAGAPSRRCARPDAGAERGGDAQRAGDDDARSGRERGRRPRAARLARPRGRGDARQHARLDGPGGAERLPGRDRPGQGSGRQARRRGADQARSTARSTPASIDSAPTRSSRSRAAVASSTRCPRPATAGRCWSSSMALFPTPSVPFPSSGRCTTRPCASCSRATATASTGSTIRPSASARSPTR